jgi:superfamily II DNA or RNA helicase
VSARTNISLTTKQRDLLAESLDFFERQIIERGTQLFARQAVRQVDWVEPDVVLQAEVQGGELYTVTLEFSPEGIETSCTCPHEIDCKHAAALILHLQVNSVVRDVPQTKTKKSPKPAAPTIPQPDADSFPGRAAARLGITLATPQLQFLQQASIWWEGRQSTVAQSDLSRLAGQQSYWGYGQLQLWPAKHPPVDEVEFFAYLAMALQSCHLSLPEGLGPLADPGVQKRLTQEWQRLKQIDEWRQRLGSWKEPQLHLAAEAPELRLMLHATGATIQVRQPGELEFGKATLKLLKQFWGGTPHYGSSPQNLLSAGSNLVLKAALQQYGELHANDIPPLFDSLAKSLGQLLSNSQLFQTHVLTATGDAPTVIDEPLRWDLQPPSDSGGDYELRLLDDEGGMPPPPLAIVPGFPLRYVTHEAVFPVNYWPFGGVSQRWPVRIPAAALETKEGVSALAKLGVPVPQRLEGRVKIIRAEIDVRCQLSHHPQGGSEYLQVRARAQFGGAQNPSFWGGLNWTFSRRSDQKHRSASKEIVQIDSSSLPPAGAWLAHWPFKPFNGTSIHDLWLEQRIQGKDWPELFLAWLDRRPKGLIVELDAELASLRDGKVAGHVRLDIEESKTGIDWFDLSVALDVSDSTLTQEEIELLLKAKGKWVRLPGKGWRKLEYQLSEAQLQELAELGLAAHDFSAEKQRLHALQLGGLAGKDTTLLSAERVAQVRRRVEEIQTRVTPQLPEGITATLRPYQTEGFHFLAYLTANRFGGVLADDMGLGKTLQTLVWIAWLRGEQQMQEPLLVICPKSVQDNWRGEVSRFFPQLSVGVWNRASAGKTGLDGKTDLLIIHYAQLRIHEDLLRKIEWGAVILDEAQAIKNPTSQNAQAACGLKARHRLALTGTPIENRLLDLWSIFAFAMPGVLGTRSTFTKNFDGKEDPHARRRLAARTRPFLLRRTKNEVARDLPDRVEEDLSIELEGTQAALYQAEIKRARAELLKAETSKQLDKLRFNILTSLLRLRQICCHPRLLGLEATATKKGRKKIAEPASESAKVSALLELLEPLMEEGQKVLVFSQFVEMLAIIEAEIQERGWQSFKLTGQTEDRGTLVNEFQTHVGAATFLISLKAGGFGLNLTAASYVVLFDPWWNPAVEAQAIDRTHRIGQQQTVFAYRLIVKNSIEEKIRLLQKQKGSLANDILGEENFAQALTLKDFQFLLGGEE